MDGAARALKDTGARVITGPADLDEPAVEAACRADGQATPQVAEALAAAKATLVARRHPGRLVIGADQMLDLDGDSLRKPATRADAAATLRRLSGRRHRLVSAAVLARDDAVLWRHHQTADLDMRALDSTAIAGYLERAGDGVLSSVGAYQLESLGAQLFTRIEGDYFTILGLPLLALLAELRRTGDAPPGLLD